MPGHLRIEISLPLHHRHGRIANIKATGGARKGSKCQAKQGISIWQRKEQLGHRRPKGITIQVGEGVCSRRTTSLLYENVAWKAGT